MIELSSDPVPTLRILNANMVESASLIDRETITFELNVASDFPLDSTRMQSLLICAVPIGVNASSCTHPQAVAITAAISDFIAFPGVVVTLPNANQARAALVIGKTAVDAIRPLANNQFFVQITASITYSGGLEMNQMSMFAKLLQNGGRDYESRVGKKFALIESTNLMNSVATLVPIVAWTVMMLATLFFI